jgi:hypothetical protein
VYTLIELNIDALNTELDYRRERMLGHRSKSIHERRWHRSQSKSHRSR